MEQNNIAISISSSLALLIVIAISAKLFFGGRSEDAHSDIRNFTLRDRYLAYQDLFTSILFAILDYTIKFYYFWKNIFYFPLGVDHRVFKRSNSKLILDQGKIISKQQTNAFYIGLRPTYALICITTYTIAVWIFHSISNTFAPFVVDQNKLLLYSLITACAVFLCDVSIIRTLIVIEVKRVNGVKKNDKLLSVFLIIYRMVIVLATGALLSFSLAIPLVEDSLMTAVPPAI